MHEIWRLENKDEIWKLYSYESRGLANTIELADMVLDDNQWYSIAVCLCGEQGKWCYQNSRVYGPTVKEFAKFHRPPQYDKTPLPMEGNPEL